jgi:hypothetical protein
MQCEFLTYYGDAGAENCLAESHAAAARHSVITVEKIRGRTNKYLQLTNVIAEKQRANAHAMPRMLAKVSAASPASCQAKIAEKK